MASSQLKSDSPLSPNSPSGSGHGSAFPFAWRIPVVQGSETVITSLHSQAPPVSVEVVSDATPDQSRRLFPTAADADDVAGVRIGHFTIQRRVGVGGMGSVFLATDERLRRNIALKILAPSLSVDSSSVQRFQNEARAAARLDHDNIARVFFYGEDAGLHYIAYEYVAGSNLRDVIRLKGKLDPAEAVNYTMQLGQLRIHEILGLYRTPQMAAGDTSPIFHECAADRAFPTRHRSSKQTRHRRAIRLLCNRLAVGYPARWRV